MILVNKLVGETPLEVIKNLKKKKLELKNETLSYAGRLDPLAEGELIILVGEENREREKYESLDKVYEFDVLSGVTTDSYDLLGLVNSTDKQNTDVEKFVKKLVGKQMQAYPPFSSFHVKGKPLFWWARNKKLSEIEIPKKQIEIYKVEVLSYRTISAKDFLEYALKRINKVKGDFRQLVIINRWKKFYEKNKNEEFNIVKLRIDCSSGTYVRSICNDMGGVAFSIKRTKIY